MQFTVEEPRRPVTPCPQSGGRRWTGPWVLAGPVPEASTAQLGPDSTCAGRTSARAREAGVHGGRRGCGRHRAGDFDERAYLVDEADATVTDAPWAVTRGLRVDRPSAY
ncbi:hypothetical protein LT493_25475 [Streptomyces tricolor]|nr:hypothetical protein [Streptomyces tricolor]